MPEWVERGEERLERGSAEGETERHGTPLPRLCLQVARSDRQVIDPLGPMEF